jgi:hypothetical protein
MPDIANLAERCAAKLAELRDLLRLSTGSKVPPLLDYIEADLATALRNLISNSRPASTRAANYISRIATALGVTDD